MACTPAHTPDSSALITVWRKSHHSNPSGECVELGPLTDGTIAVRNSREPHGPALIFDAETMCSFIDAASDGRLDWVLDDHSRFQQVDGGMLIRGGSGESGPG